MLCCTMHHRYPCQWHLTCRMAVLHGARFQTPPGAGRSAGLSATGSLVLKAMLNAGAFCCKTGSCAPGPGCAASSSKALLGGCLSIKTRVVHCQSTSECMQARSAGGRYGTQGTGAIISAAGHLQCGQYSPGCYGKRWARQSSRVSRTVVCRPRGVRYCPVRCCCAATSCEAWARWQGRRRVVGRAWAFCYLGHAPGQPASHAHG